MTLLLPNDCVKPVFVDLFGCHVLPYVDTVGTLISNQKRRHNPTIFADLHAANQGRFLKESIGDKQDPAAWSVWLHQPTPQTLLTLHHYGQELNRLHISLDMDLHHANRVIPHIVQKWRGSRKSNDIEETSYFSYDARTARNIAYYPTKPSKITGQLCGHLEFRFTRKQTLESPSLDKAAPLSLLEPFDIEKFVKQQVKLVYLDKASWYRREKFLAKKFKRNRETLESYTIEQVVQSHRRMRVRRMRHIYTKVFGEPSFSNLEGGLKALPLRYLYDYFPMFRNCFKPLKEST